MPLFVGGDLRPGSAAAVRAHIDACPGCREELEGFRAAMAEIKASAKAEGVSEWGEGEWAAAMSRVDAEARRGRQAPDGAGAPGFRPRWATAAALGTVIGLALLAVLFRGPAIRSGGTSGQGPTTVAASRIPQDTIAITMVSPESGLQVVWILDKSFDWKGDQE
jgi:anti-sigma factor RsiW